MSGREELLAELSVNAKAADANGMPRTAKLLRAAIDELTRPQPADGGDGDTQVKRFTAYRRNLSQQNTHTHFQRNADDMPQFEGVVFTDGSAAIRWLTACKSTSVWSSLEDLLNIHGHPEYGTEIMWHDSDPPKEWLDQVAAIAAQAGEGAGK